MPEVNTLIEIHNYLRTRCTDTLSDLLQLPQPGQLHLFNPHNAVFLTAMPPSPGEMADFLTGMFVEDSEVWFTTQAGHLLSMGMLNVDLLINLCNRIADEQPGLTPPDRSHKLFYDGEVFVTSPTQPGTHICTDKDQLQQLYNQLTYGLTQLMTIRLVNRLGNALRLQGREIIPDFLTLSVEVPVSDTQVLP